MASVCPRCSLRQRGVVCTWRSLPTAPSPSAACSCRRRWRGCRRGRCRWGNGRCLGTHCLSHALELVLHLFQLLPRDSFCCFGIHQLEQQCLVVCRCMALRAEHLLGCERRRAFREFQVCTKGLKNPADIAKLTVDTGIEGQGKAVSAYEICPLRLERRPSTRVFELTKTV